MKLNYRWFRAVVPLLMLVISGCASVPMASMDEDAKAKSFVVPTSKSNIYVYRNESLGGAIPMTVALDGKVAGQSAMQTYFFFQVDPGSHEVSSIAENTSTIKLATEAGKAYYVWQEVKMGMWIARSQYNRSMSKPVARGFSNASERKAISSIRLSDGARTEAIRARGFAVQGPSPNPNQRIASHW